MNRNPGLPVRPAGRNPNAEFPGRTKLGNVGGLEKKRRNYHYTRHVNVAQMQILRIGIA